MPYARAEPAPPPDTTQSSAPGPPTNLREFIQVLADREILVRITEPVHWQFDLGRIARAIRRPVLFENILDYPGHRLFTNGLWSPDTIRLALGFSPNLPPKTFLTEIRKRVDHPIAPQLSANGPVLQNIIEGDAINLLHLPVPQWHSQDVGRYLGTWHLNVTRHPETGVRNIGVYRMQLLGPRQATVSASSRSHLAQHVARAEQARQPLPMTVVIGVAEPLIMAAGAACPVTMDEYEVAGALLQQPVQLTRSRPEALEIPADAEIAIEGILRRDVRVQDGPYFDYAGHVSVDRDALVFEAQRLLYRNNPIFRGASIGFPGAEDHQLFAFLAQLNMFDFHGSRIRHAAQNMLFKTRCFSTLQQIDRINRESLRRFLRSH